MKRIHRVLLSSALFFLLYGCVSLFRRALEGPITQADGEELSTPLDGNEDVFKFNETSRINSTLCQYNECLEGRWVPREPQFKTLADFQDVFAKRGASIWSQCKPPPPPAGTERTLEETNILGEQRIVDIMNWVWQPDRGEQIPWDPQDLVVRLLKSPGGLVLMGDSLTQGHDHAFGSYLQEAGIAFDTNPNHLPLDKSIRTHILRPGHPLTLELQKRAGVPNSRLDYPIFSIIEEHLLVHEPDLRFLTGLYGAKEGWGWFLDSMKRADDWEAFFHWVTAGRPGEEDTVTGDTILLMNTGAHWSRGTLHMLPKLGSATLERSVLTQLYQTMAKMVIQKLSQFSRLTVFYRATNPGHPMCHLHNKPLANATVAYELESRFLELSDASANSENDKIVRRRWDWDLFNVNNHVWEKEIRLLQNERKALQQRKPDLVSGVKWLFVDVYEMALQRPDAHNSPGSDCLHWCLPSMYNEWSRHLYHLIYLEMEK